MKKQCNINQKDPVNIILRFCLGIVLSFTFTAAIIMSSLHTSATGTTSVESDVAVIVPASCTMGGVGSNTHNATLSPGTWSGASGSEYENGIGKTVLTTYCNDYNGFSIYAIGYTDNEYGNTNLVDTAHNNLTIPTGVYSTGDTASKWSMKVTKETDSTISYNPVNMNITNSFDNWHIVPSTYTQVAQYKANTGSSMTDTLMGAKVNTTYAAYISSTQAADTYNGQVKYTMVHPYNADVPAPATLYDSIAVMSKGKQSVTDIRTAITIPTSANRTEDTSNSGVYEYDSTVFGVASDASNDYKIYYYRGVLENEVGTYGSDGSAVTYPNYVVLSSANNKSGLATTDTCWRIVRTTGSGGVKMIYNGAWTGSTCANIESNAQVGTSAFNGTSSTNKQIVRVGYTYNSAYATNTASTASIADVFGTNSSPQINDAGSNIKTYIENTWFPTIDNYEDILEPSAGYCNDRTFNEGDGWTTPLDENTDIVTFIDDVNTGYRFGAGVRNITNVQIPSLRCAKYSNLDRGIVDLYTADDASDGNKQLYKPVALLAVDEATLAGSGRDINPHHANSYLRSHAPFWTFSPNYRNLERGIMGGLDVNDGGYIGGNYISRTLGVRPVISLIPGTTPASGTGIATDPWIINPR